MAFHQHTLANGLQIVGESNPEALSVGMAIWCRTGARDETPDISGVSHYLEHMVFKGSARRTSFEVNRDFSRIGADNNAWTSEENTCYYASVLPEFLPQLADVLADMLRPALRQADFDTEKTVILDEIARYEVQPMSAAYETARKIYYGDHPLGYSVLGSSASVAALTRDRMQEYFDRRYVASNMHVAVAGKFDWAEIVELVEANCGHWPKGEVGREHRHQAGGVGGIHMMPRPADKVAQEYMILISPSPSASSPMRYNASALTAIVGDSSGSRFFWALVDPGLADSVGMGWDGNDSSGANYVSLSCEPDKAVECYEIIREILADVQENGVTEEELRLALAKITSREVRAAERTGYRMRAVGQDWTYLNEYRSLDTELAAWDLVSVAGIRELLDAWPLTDYSTFALGPLESLA